MVIQTRLDLIWDSMETSESLMLTASHQHLNDYKVGYQPNKTLWPSWQLEMYCCIKPHPFQATSSSKSKTAGFLVNLQCFDWSINWYFKEATQACGTGWQWETDDRWQRIEELRKTLEQLDQQCQAFLNETMNFSLRALWLSAALHTSHTS